MNIFYYDVVSVVLIPDAKGSQRVDEISQTACVLKWASDILQVLSITKRRSKDKD